MAKKVKKKTVMKKRSTKLTPMQHRFCHEYVIDNNGTQAAIRAGYAPKNAHVTASKYLRISKVKAYVRKLKLELQKKTSTDAEKVIEEFKKIGFANIQDYLHGENNIRNLCEVARDKAAAVESVSTTVNITSNKDGSKEYETRNVKFKLHSKIQALDNLAKHLGLFERDNRQREFNILEIVGMEPLVAKKKNNPE